jgi:hypothetical protein
MNEAFRPTDVMQQGMMDPNPGMQGMSNAMDSGADSKVVLNNQQQRAQQLLAQKLRADVQTAAPQAAADAMRMEEKTFTENSGTEAKAMTLKNETMAKALDSLGGGKFLMELNAVMQSPERARLTNDMEVSRAMFAKESPDLGAADASAQQYMA